LITKISSLSSFSFCYSPVQDSDRREDGRGSYAKPERERESSEGQDRAIRILQQRKKGVGGMLSCSHLHQKIISNSII
jgi:hypothetical protein